jgi:hypothetical protein
MTATASEHGSPGIPALIAAASPATLVQWGVLVLIFFTSPIQPYTDGMWGTVTLACLAGLGALTAVVGRGAPGLVGLIVGFGAAAAIQLFVLGGQAEANIGVVASLSEPPWSERVLTALALGLSLLVVGYLVVAGSRAAIGRWQNVATDRAGWLGRIALVTGVFVGAALSVGLLVGSIASSAYVLPSGQPSIALEVSGDEIVSSSPTGTLVGRSELVVRRTRDGVGAIAITMALTPEERVALEAGRIPYDRIGVVFIGGSTGPRDERRQVQFESPASYAFVVWDEEQPPNAAGDVTVLDAQVFDVVAPASGETAPADGGVAVQLGGLFGVLVAAWSAAGSTLMARRRRWADRGRPAARDLWLAATVGVGAALALAFLALAAIDLARNPF